MRVDILIIISLASNFHFFCFSPSHARTSWFVPSTRLSFHGPARAPAWLVLRTARPTSAHVHMGVDRCPCFFRLLYLQLGHHISRFSLHREHFKITRQWNGSRSAEIFLHSVLQTDQAQFLVLFWLKLAWSVLSVCTLLQDLTGSSKTQSTLTVQHHHEIQMVWNYTWHWLTFCCKIWQSPLTVQHHHEIQMVYSYTGTSHSRVQWSQHTMLLP